MGKLVFTRLIAIAVSAIALFGCSSQPEIAARPQPIPLFAFYYGWYGTPPLSGEWVHWDGNGHDPTTLLESGQPDIMAVHHPLAGPYDSTDPAVISRQLADLQAAGIDALIVSWWGKGSREDAQMKLLMDAIEGSGSPLRVAPYLEQVVDPAAAPDDIVYLVETFGSRPSALKMNGRPSVFLYGRTIFVHYFCVFEQCPNGADDIDWTPLVAAVRSRVDVWLCADAMGAMLFDYVPTLAGMGFDAVHVYNPHVEVALKLDLASGWRDHVADARALGLDVGATVIPGYDDTPTGRFGASRIDRRDGQLYREQWSFAAGAKPDYMLLTSFNEWHEGTEIEPSVELGRTYLELSAELVAAGTP